jgi:NAD dependent epimerase/dehydratase family enzyme
MANALLLTSQRAVPQRLLAEGFRFDYSEVEPALRHELKT